jgi:hypothetical protein
VSVADVGATVDEPDVDRDGYEFVTRRFDVSLPG